jgi:hypothetical protein
VYIIIIQQQTKQIRNKLTNITVLIFVDYVHLLQVSIQLDHHQEMFMKCTTRYGIVFVVLIHISDH